MMRLSTEISRSERLCSELAIIVLDVDGVSYLGNPVMIDPGPRVIRVQAPPAAGFRFGEVRTIAFDVADVNGGRTIESWPIVVGNRRPVRGTQPAPFTVDHVFDRDAQAYVADVPLTSWSDPDGDPLRFTTGATTGDLECPEVVVDAGLARARCRLAFAGAPAVANFAGTRGLTAKPNARVSPPHHHHEAYWISSWRSPGGQTCGTTRIPSKIRPAAPKRSIARLWIAIGMLFVSTSLLRTSMPS